MQSRSGQRLRSRPARSRWSTSRAVSERPMLSSLSAVAPTVHGRRSTDALRAAAPAAIRVHCLHGLAPPASAPGLGSPRPHRRPDWAHRCHIGARTGLTPATSAPGLGPPRPHLRPDWADSRRRISCRGGLRSAANLHVFWSEPLAHLRADEKRSAGWVKLQCERNHACAFWLSASAMRRTIRCVGTFRSRRAFPNRVPGRAVPCPRRFNPDPNSRPHGPVGPSRFYA